MSASLNAIRLFGPHPIPDSDTLDSALGHVMAYSKCCDRLLLLAIIVAMMMLTRTFYSNYTVSLCV